MFRTFLLAGAAMFAASGAAMADAYYEPAPSYAPAAVAHSVFSWTGFYLGAHAGVLFNDTEVDTIGLAPGNITNVRIDARPGRVDFEDEGFMGGGQIGYNHQMGPWVVGVEADISGTDLDDSTRFLGTPTPNVPGAPNPSTFVQSMDYFGTVRGRIGYAHDRWLGYVTGGYAYADIETDVIFLTGANQLQFRGRGSETVDGYTIGGGVEYAWSNHVTFKGEGLYYDLDDSTVFVDNIPGVGAGAYSSSFENDGVLVRGGVNFKFSGIFGR